MKKIDWYILKKFLSTFFYAIGFLVIIIIIFDISEKIDDFIEKEAPLNEIIFNYYFTFIPYFINMFSALFTFISVIFFTSRLAYNTEIIAILSSGTSFWRMLRPYLIGAVLISTLSYTLGNFIIPNTNRIMLEFEDTYIRNPKNVNDRDIHLQISPGTHVYFQSFNPKRNRGSRFSLEKFGDSGMIYKINSQSILWDTTSNSWKIKKYTRRSFHGMHETISEGKELDTILELHPTDFTRKVEDLKTMNYFELNDFIDREKMRGSNKIREFEVESHKRLAFPISSIILTIIGVSVSSRKVRGGTGLHLGIGLALAFGYILFMQIASVFGTYGNISPLLAVWIPNMLFGIIAIFLAINAPK